MLRRGLSVALSVIGGSVLAVGTVHADQPERFEYEFFDEFVDTEVCAAEPWQFDVHATEHGYGSVEIFFDADGNFVRGIDHLNLDFTISANGITLTERDQINTFFDADGFAERGLWTHIQSPHGGIVLLDAGQLVFDPDGNLVRAPGRHPQFFGASFCDALVPTG
jgi:hypothetical protein